MLDRLIVERWGNGEKMQWYLIYNTIEELTSKYCSTRNIITTHYIIVSKVLYWKRTFIICAVFPIAISQFTVLAIGLSISFCICLPVYILGENFCKENIMLKQILVDLYNFYIVFALLLKSLSCLLATMQEILLINFLHLISFEKSTLILF